MNEQITCPHCGDTYPDFDAAHVCSKGPYAPKLKPKMNERIRELMLEAGYAAPEIAGRANKFAELIVRECAAIADRAEPYKSTDLILKHFGVEE
jgi:hypothetical protein